MLCKACSGLSMNSQNVWDLLKFTSKEKLELLLALKWWKLLYVISVFSAYNSNCNCWVVSVVLWRVIFTCCAMHASYVRSCLFGCCVWEDLSTIQSFECFFKAVLKLISETVWNVCETRICLSVFLSVCVKINGGIASKCRSCAVLLRNQAWIECGRGSGKQTGRGSVR